MPSGRIEHGTLDSPEIVTEVNDNNQWEVQDSDGNVIARFDQDQAVNLFSDLFDAANSQTVYDSSTQEVKADVNNSAVTTAQINNDIYTSKEGGLSAAISASSPGDRILFDADETIGSLMDPPSNRRIEGRNDAVLSAGSAITGGMFWTSGAVSNLHIEGLEFDGGGFDTRSFRVNGALDNVRIEDCTFRNFQGSDAEVVFFDGSPTDCHVVNNHWESTCNDMLFRSQGGADGLFVRDNTIEAASCFRVIYINQANGANNHIRVINNTSRAEPTNQSIRVENGSDVWVNHNYVTSAAEAFGSTTTGGAGDNISLNQCTNFKAIGNTVDGSGEQGLGVSNSAGAGIIAENEIRDCDVAGIYITASGGTPPVRVKVIGNEVFNCMLNRAARTFTDHGGIRLSGAITNCKISDNDSYGHGTASTDGYGLNYDSGGSSDENVVVGNDLSGNQTGATENTPGASSVVANNVT